MSGTKDNGGAQVGTVLALRQSMGLGAQGKNCPYLRSEKGEDI